MLTLTDLDCNHSKFVDQSTVIYGPSGTGKSFIIIDILHTIRDYVDSCIIISPMDRQNHTYDDIIPTPLIHYNLSDELLRNIWERQSALANVYTRATDIKIINSLFNRISKRNMELANEQIKKINDAYDNFALTTIDEKLKIKVKKECESFILKIKHHFIEISKKELQQIQLSEEEKYSLLYHNINPRLVLIFDDCTPDLNKHKNNETLQKIFYQGRWAFITTIFALHTDKALSPEVKKNTFVTIFTSEQTANSYFDRKSNDIDREAKLKAVEACKAAFVNTNAFQKLAYDRKENAFYKYTAKKHENFKFGAPIIWTFCNKIKDSGGSLLGNKYIDLFNTV